MPRSVFVPADEAALLEALVTLGLLNWRQIEVALGQRPPGSRLGEALVAAHLIDRAVLADFERFYADWQAAKGLVDFPIPAELLARVPAAFCLRRRVLPLRVVGDRLVVAYPAGLAGTLEETHLLDQLGAMVGQTPLGWPVPEGPLLKACHHYFDEHSAQGAINRALEVETYGDHERHDAWEGGVADAPIADLVNDLLTRAIDARASDLHLDPLPDGLLARIRVDGVLRDLLVVPKPLRGAVANRIKLMAELNITEHRAPQDGRFTFTLRDQPFDMRVAVVPSRWGELVVIRILRPLARVQDLTALGLTEPGLSRFKRALTSPHGIVLVTGPTGSGKSSTLYTGLHMIDRVENHVVTVEDPVEFNIERAMQIQVNPRAGLTFAAALRSILRLDPNVIMVGEIRDHETLSIALDAAMTGHLVLSTLHTNDAASSFARLAELGASPQRMATSVVAVVAQRLVRRLCQGCRRPGTATEAECRLLGLEPREAPLLHQAVGCAACGGTGFAGRLGIYEVLEVDTAIAEALLAGESAIGVRRVAEHRGMVDLAADGRSKVLAGLTTLKEVARVVRDPALG